MPVARTNPFILRATNFPVIHQVCKQTNVSFGKLQIIDVDLGISRQLIH